MGGRRRGDPEHGQQRRRKWAKINKIKNRRGKREGRGGEEEYIIIQAILVCHCDLILSKQRWRD